jgi:hypothetical protein
MMKGRWGRFGMAGSIRSGEGGALSGSVVNELQSFWGCVGDSNRQIGSYWV